MDTGGAGIKRNGREPGKPSTKASCLRRLILPVWSNAYDFENVGGESYMTHEFCRLLTAQAKSNH
jgi:hypothetical protein